MLDRRLPSIGESWDLNKRMLKVLRKANRDAIDVSPIVSHLSLTKEELSVYFRGGRRKELLVSPDALVLAVVIHRSADGFDAGSLRRHPDESKLDLGQTRDQSFAALRQPWDRALAGPLTRLGLPSEIAEHSEAKSRLTLSRVRLSLDRQRPPRVADLGPNCAKVCFRVGPETLSQAPRTSALRP